MSRSDKKRQQELERQALKQIDCLLPRMKFGSSAQITLTNNSTGEVVNFLLDEFGLCVQGPSGVMRAIMKRRYDGFDKRQEGGDIVFTKTRK